MDIIPEEHNQNQDNAVDQIISECIRTPVILREILEHISNPELVKFSIVNKLWNHQARSVLRKRGNLPAHLKCDEDVAAFVVDLGRMIVVPFSGISIKIRHWDDGEGPCSFGAFDPPHHGILNRLSLKHVSVALLGQWYSQYMDCPGFMVAKQLLQHFSGVFEQLSLNISGVFERQDIIEQVLQNRTFLRLRILKLGEEYNDYCTSEEEYTNYIKALVSRAPILQELHIQGKINLMTNVLEGRSSVVLVLKHAFRAPFDDFSENAMSAVRLENILLVYTGSGFNFERFNRITPAILQAYCTTTLRRVCVDAVLAVPLMLYGICLENVTDLRFFINYSHLDLMGSRIWGIVKNFDFSRLLPKLNTVRVTRKALHHELSADVREFIQQADAVLSNPKPDRAVNIKWLILDDSVLNFASQFCADMFPSIKKLDLEVRDYRGFSFGSVFPHWVDLEILNVESRRTPINFDSFFCGIFPEEVEELRQKDEEYLEKVNIVPVMPAITCLRNLRTLTLDFGTCEDANTSTFSKLSELIAFKRCLNLAVTLVTKQASVYQGLSHMKPYVSVQHVG